LKRGEKKGQGPSRLHVMQMPAEPKTEEEKIWKEEKEGEERTVRK